VRVLFELLFTELMFLLLPVSSAASMGVRRKRRFSSSASISACVTRVDARSGTGEVRYDMGVSGRIAGVCASDGLCCIRHQYSYGPTMSARRRDVTAARFGEYWPAAWRQRKDGRRSVNEGLVTS